ncbi:hypothetical protein B0H21DRAFT_333507 [Amylocystis lapponica]|nr:hypothetical protein B0H21DRAFT_333507 [Amylocystis lapponica]
MSRANRQSMGPPHDIVMGPPPLPPQVSQATTPKPRDSQDIAEKYRRLKRKYFELEERHKESLIQLQSSGERNVKWRSERALFLDRITELETNPTFNPNAHIPDPPFTAFPRSLLSTNGQKHFVTNLRHAIDEVDREDPDIDPLLLSRHVGPQARKRQEAELRERQEEDAREARRAARRPRAPHKGKDMSTPLTYAPAPHSASAPPPSMGHNPSPPVLVSSTGTRLRLKPPAPPHAEDPALHASSSGHNHGSTPMSHQSQPRSESPVSPMLSPQEDYPMANVAMSPSYQHPIPAPTQGQMQMTLRASSASSSSSRPSEIQRHAKPKRLKAHTVTTKSFSIPTVPRDKKGKPLLPLNVGIMTVVKLGDVCIREHFHTERYIFPVGYEVTRRYSSTTDPNSEVVYHCTILDGGDGPKFRIVAADMPDKPVIAGTATGAWSTIVKEANRVRNRQHSNSVSGPDFFGLGQNTIKHLIQELPNTKYLKDYVWQHFVEGGPLGGRHAAVIPALPEDNEGNVQGVVYYEHEFDPDRPRELQIIHVDSEDPSRVRQALPPPPSMKPLTFHQEYAPRPPERERERLERRNSRASNPAYDEYSNGGSESPAHHRPVSHSPVIQRESTRDRERERDHYSPHQHPPPGHARTSARASPHHRSPYQAHASAHNGPGPEPGTRMREYGPPGTPPPVPPTFASIMHAYPQPPRAQSPPHGEPGAGPEYVYANGGGRRNGHASPQTFPSVGGER